MKNLWKEPDGSYKVIPGAHIAHTIKEAIALSEQSNTPISFCFNGVNITVTQESDPDLIDRDWLRALNGYIPENVGPHPKPVLSQAELDNDARIEAENLRRYQKERAKAQFKRKVNRIFSWVRRILN